MAPLEITLVTIKFASLMLLLLSSGGVLFNSLYSDQLTATKFSIQKRLLIGSVIALFLSVVYLFLDAARFSGSLSGIFDFELQKLIMLSHLGTSKVLLVVGLIVMIWSFNFMDKGRTILSIIGISLIAFSFSYTGHTSEHALRVILAPLLMLHIIVVIFWFGSLIPLYYIVKNEPPQCAGLIVCDFSKKATYLVPLIFVAGIIMSAVLMDGINFLNHTYGQILLFKAVTFSVLMLIAALNKWRYGPELENGIENSAHKLRRAILMEILLIALIVMATVILTSFFSPMTL